MSIAEAAAVSAAEAKVLFSDFLRMPALVLAVSGGPDSTALMLLAARWRTARKRGPRLVAVTVDHGLRPEAKAEAVAVGRLAHRLGLSHRILRWRGPKPKTGLQQAARLARYRLLARAARVAGAPAILTAHTLDDQAETVLIRMARGSGLRGLAAMAKYASLDMDKGTPSPLAGQDWKYEATTNLVKLPLSGRTLRGARRKAEGETESAARAETPILLVRPLLEIPKIRLIATLQAAKIPYSEDPSNRDPRFTRARLRQLMPALAREGLNARRLAILARRLRRADAAIESAVQCASNELARPAVAGVLAFAAEDLGRLPAEVALRLIGRALERVGDEGPVELGKLEALKTALDGAQADKNACFRRTLAGAIVTLTDNVLLIERAPRRRGRTLTTHGQGKGSAMKTR